MNLYTFKAYIDHKLVRKCYKHFVTYVCRVTVINGRFLVSISLIIYFSLIFSSSLVTEYDDLWNSLGVPAMTQPFGDLRVITSGWECHRLGYDVIVENPCNPWPSYKEANYPRIWMAPVALGLDQSHTISIGILLSLLFYIMVFAIIEQPNFSEAIIYSIILCSPAVMLGVERANNDLVIFIILAFSVMLLNSQNIFVRLISYAAILFASILKFYPIFTLVVVFKEKKKRQLMIGFLLLAIFSIYVFVTLEDIRLIRAATPQVNYWSYGSRIIFNMFSEHLAKIFKTIDFEETKFYGYLSYLDSATLTRIVILGSMLFLTLVKSNDAVTYLPSSSHKFLDSFRLGASIYIGTFVLWNNWAYRLIFLIFTIPQILSWIKTSDRWGLLSRISLVCIILTLFLKTTAQGSILYLDQLFNWFLFFYLFYALLLTLPDWLKALFDSRSKKTFSC
jgi:hypothetical protein